MLEASIPVIPEKSAHRFAFTWANLWAAIGPTTAATWLAGSLERLAQAQGVGPAAGVGEIDFVGSAGLLEK